MPELDKLSSRFRPLYHYGPVTALKIYKHYIIAGYGPILKIFHINDQVDLIFDKQVFQRNKIHHIDINPENDTFVVSGGRSFLVLRLGELIDARTVSAMEHTINEWIVTSYVLDDNHILLLNSHNTIIKIDKHNFSVVDKIDCKEKSILYSGSITKLPSGDIYVAAGTVMNGTIIWDLHSQTIKHNLTDHEGSIFGIKIDPSGQYIVSCSDDRSIKLYSFNEGKLLATGWGHGSRIWCLEFFSGEPLKIMSCGEDCTMRMWEYRPGNDLLQQIDLWENFHRGKHIWSGDVDNVELNIAVTGGADGKVRVHDLTQQDRQKFSLAEISFNISLNKSDFIRDYFELPEFLVLLMSNGYLLIRKDNTFTSLGHFAEFDGFGIVSGFADLGVVLVCARDGRILSIDGSATPTWITNPCNNKIVNMLLDTNCGRHFVLLESPNPNVPFTLHELTYTTSLQISKTWDIPKPELRFSVTAMTIDTVHQKLILASKKVTIGVFDLKTLAATVFRKVSPGDSVSSLSIINTTPKSLQVLVVARDGFYTIADISGTSALNILQQNKITRGVIEGGFMNNNDLILYGFKSSYFFVWNETKQMEIMNEQCGGSGHRHYKFYHDAAEYFKFIYTLKNELCIRTHHVRFSNTFGLIQNGTHGREIRDVAISSDHKLVATSSEDSSICLSKLSDDGKLVNVWNMTNHVSGMQKIKFLSKDFIASSAANEEFIVWKLSWSQDLPMLMEYTRLNPTKEIPDLRVMDFSSIKSDTGFTIATVYSDSNIKIWQFDLDSGFHLLKSWFYSTCCILNCQFLNNHYLLISTTDGCVTIYDIATAKPVAKEKLHQSGVKAISIHQDYLITGGDDNAITVSQFDNTSIKLIDRVENAASATITSIGYVDDKSFITTSVDQIIRLWSFSLGKLVCHEARYTTIADTGCCDTTTVNSKTLAVVGGAGISTWEILY